MSRLVIATRESPLALWQARFVADALEKRTPALKVELLKMSTAGDRFLQAPLSQVGGKGLFVKEIEAALLERRADLAVHSLKDMTSEMPEGLLLACVPEREDPRDAWVSPEGIPWDDIPKEAKLGTASLRRSCMILERRPDLQIVSLRGNVQTRLRKIREQGLAGAVLAYAGLKRLGLEREVTEALAPEVSLPAVGQGVLAIQCRSDDARVRELLTPLEHAETRLAIRAERAFLAHLEGSCSVPLAGYALRRDGKLWLRGWVGSPDGAQVIRGEGEAERDGKAAERMGTELAGRLLKEGGREILEALKNKH